MTLPVAGKKAKDLKKPGADVVVAAVSWDSGACWAVIHLQDDGCVFAAGRI